MNDSKAKGRIIAMGNAKSQLLHAFIAACILVLGGCNNGSTGPYGGSGSSTPAKASPNTVVISNYSFSPASLTVTKGTVVTWQNNDAVAHTSTSDNGVWDTGNIPAASNKTTTFSVAGTYTYHCTYHPMMTGTIIVQ